LFTKFQSTHPVWDATCLVRSGDIRMFISIHASRVGCDKMAGILYMLGSIFQSTHPVWDATVTTLLGSTNYEISIHASRVGCDAMHNAMHDRQTGISIHASRVGCDKNGISIRQIVEYF